MSFTITIVGGGITGLTVAYRLMSLKKQDNLPIEIILIESSNRLGGVIKSEAVNDFIVEHGPDAFLAQKAELKNLLAELSLTEELLSTNENNRQAFIAKDNKLMPLPAGFFMIAPTKWLPFIGSPLFTWLGKLRIMLEVFIPKRKSTNDESVASFLNRRFGKELLTRIGQPLAGGIYMADINLLSAKSTLSQFVDLEEQFGSIIKGLPKIRHSGASTASGARYNLFSTLKTGTQTLADRLVTKLTDVKICLNAPLLTVDHGSEKKWQIETTTGQIATDAIVFALPAQSAAHALKKFDPILAQTLAKIESSNSVVVNLLYNKSDIGKSYKGFGFVIPSVENKKIIAAAFISQKFPDRASKNQAVIRVFIGGQLAPNLVQLSDQELIDLAQSTISSYLEIKRPAIKTWLSRWPNGLPFYQIGHHSVVKKIETLSQNHPGFFFTGSSYNGVGIPDCVRDGEKTAVLLATLIQQRKLKCLSPAI